MRTRSVESKGASPTPPEVGGTASVPELPEVETIRRDLDGEVVGRRIKSVQVKGRRSIRRHRGPAEFKGLLEGHKIVAVSRRGKYLLLSLDDGDILVVHLGMSGQLLRPSSAREAAGRHMHVSIAFTRGGELRFVDPRTFGEMFVASEPVVAHEVPELGHLGFDPLTEAMSWIHFSDLLRARKTKLKPLLMDQRFVAGIGNIYSDEILFAAGLRHDRSSETLSSEEVRRLYRAMVETLSDAVRHRGSSLADQQYCDLFGRPGDFQEHHQVYDREGLPCPRCHRAVTRIKLAGRSSFLCEGCQV
jgi:formamidopyrimidine-DNA glycosylase